MGSFEEEYFRYSPKYGSKIADKYITYSEKNPIKENATLAERMEHMGGFCKLSKLERPATFLEIEQKRDETKMGHLRHYAAAAIMIRGESVPVSPILREKIKARMRRKAK